MPLQIRRGSTSERFTITPLPGELIYDTTTGQIFIGDGISTGGVVSNNVSLEDVRNTASSLLTTGFHSGLIFSYDNQTHQINSQFVNNIVPFQTDAINLGTVELAFKEVNLTSNGKINFGSSSISATPEYLAVNVGIRQEQEQILFPNLMLSSFNQNSQFSGYSLFTRSRGTAAQPLAINLGDSIHQLVFSALRGNSQKIAASIQVSSDPAGSISDSTAPGKIEFHTMASSGVETRRLEIDSIGRIIAYGQILVSSSNVGRPALDVFYANNTAIAETASLSRARGTPSALTSVQTGDRLCNLVWRGFDGANMISSASIVADIVGPVSQGKIPTDLSFGTTRDSGELVFGVRITKNQVLETNLLDSFGAATISVLVPITGSLIGSVSADDNTLIIDSQNGGKITAPSVSISEFLQLPVILDDADRLSLIPTPTKGMVIMIETGVSPIATNQLQLFNGTDWVVI
jgi:hypothetical protein